MPGGPAPRADNFLDDLAQTEDLIAHSADFTELYKRVPAVSFKRAKAVKGDEFDQALTEEATDLRNGAKKLLEKLKTDYFTRSPEQHLKSLSDMKPVIETLVQLVISYGKRFEAAKQEKSIIDFSDLEHYCLSILTAVNESGSASRVRRRLTIKSSSKRCWLTNIKIQILCRKPYCSLSQAGLKLQETCLW